MQNLLQKVLPQKNNSKVLGKASLNALEVFTKTINGLKALNSRVLFAKEANTSKIQELVAENTELERLETTNQQIIEKINNILN